MELTPTASGGTRKGKMRRIVVNSIRKNGTGIGYGLDHQVPIMVDFKCDPVVMKNLKEALEDARELKEEFPRIYLREDQVIQ